MGGAIAELVAELLQWFLDIKFWFKKRKRRKFEKEHNLPKKTMLYPSDKITIALMALGLISILIFFLLIFPAMKENRTKDKLMEIIQILDKEKKDVGVYPNELKHIIRNNPLRKNITLDSWNTPFEYRLINDGAQYVLFSSGKDRQPNTKDDIHFNN